MAEPVDAAGATGGGTGRPPSSTGAFWIGVVVGLPILAVGIRGVMENSRDVRPPELARWIVGSAIVHDGIVFPLVALVAVVGRRWVASWAWPAVRWALFTTGILLVVSRPYVAGYGYSPGNPTALARNYGRGVAVAIALVWLAAGGWALVTRSRRPPDEHVSVPGSSA